MRAFCALALFPPRFLECSIGKGSAFMFLAGGAKLIIVKYAVTKGRFSFELPI
jgi:hypothetical protein